MCIALVDGPGRCLVGRQSWTVFKKKKKIPEVIEQVGNRRAIGMFQISFRNVETADTSMRVACPNIETMATLPAACVAYVPSAESSCGRRVGRFRLQESKGGPVRRPLVFGACLAPLAVAAVTVSL